MDPPQVFVGRDDLVRQTLHLLGAARGVVFAGPEGIGRTTVLEHSTHAARRAGFAVARWPEETPELGVLVVDDLDELETESIDDLFRHLEETQGRLLATVEDERPLAEPLAQHLREGRVERVDLDPLDEQALAALAESVLGTPLDSVALTRIAQWSAGHPRDALDVLCAARDQGCIVHRSGVAILSDGFPSSPQLQARLDGLLDAAPESVLDFVDLLAVARALPDSALDSVGLAGAARAAEDAGIARSVLQAGAISWVFASPLLGALARDRLPADLAADRRRQAVKLLDDGSDEYVLAAGELHADDHEPCSPDCAGTLASAVDAAHRRVDLTLLEHLASVAYRRDGDWSAGARLCDVYELTGRPAAEIAVARDLIDQADDDGQRFLAGLFLTSAQFSNGADEEIGPTLRALRNRIGDSTWVDQLDARELAFLALAGRFGEVESRGTALLDSPLAAGHAAIWVGFGRAVGGRFDAARDAIDAGEGTGAPGLALHPVFAQLLEVVRASSLVYAGDPGGAEEICRAGHRAAVEQGDRFLQAWFAHVLGHAAQLRGSHGTARQCFTDAAAAFSVMHEPRLARWALAGLAQAAALGGDVELGARSRQAVLDVDDGQVAMLEPEVRRAVAWVDVVEGSSERAHRTLDEAARLAESSGQHTFEVAALHDLARLGDAEHAADALSDPARASDGRFLPARVAHIDALAHHDLEGARWAAEEFEALGAWMLAAESWAGIARDGDDPVSAAGARRRALAALARTEAGGSPLLEGTEPPRLGARARSVADLAAAGIRRRDIARSLHVAVSTVDSHLHTTFRALGIDGRGKLADALADLDRIEGATSGATSTGDQRPLADGAPFVGRTDELARVRRHLTGPDARGVVLVGEAGIGKSRLLEEIGGELRVQGRTVVRAEDAWRTGLPSIAGTQERPVVLADDLDRVDHAELDALMELVTSARAVVVAAQRDEDASSLAAASLVVVRVERLSLDETARLVRGRLGGLVLHSTIEQFSHLGGGNPLWVQELLRSALTDGALVNDSGAWQLRAPLDPDRRLRSLVESRLAVLDRPALGAFDRLTATGSLHEALAGELLDRGSLDRLISLDLVVVDGDGVRPAHPLYAEVRRDALGAAARRDWFATLLEAGRRLPTYMSPGDEARWKQGAGEAGPVSERVGSTLHGERAGDSDGLEDLEGDPRSVSSETGERWLLASRGAISSPELLDACRLEPDDGHDAAEDLDILARWVLLIEAGDVAGADHLAAHGATGSGRHSSQGRGLALGARMLRAGRAGGAITAFGDVLASEPRLPHSPWSARAHAGLVVAHTLAGRPTRARNAYAALVQLATERHFIARRARAWLDVADGRRRRAIGELAEAGREARERGSLVCALEAWHDALLLGDTTVAAPALAAVDDHDLAPGPAVRIEHARAVLEGRGDRLVAVCGQLRALGFELGALHALEAAHLVGTNPPVALERAVVRSVEPSALRFVEQRWIVATLTARQCEIAELAAAGTPSRAIAAELSLSRRTVENHLQRAYERLGVAGRAELAAAFGRAPRVALG